MEINLTIGSTFGLLSGVLTSIGLILSNYGSKMKYKTISLILISLALSDSFSDALGIYYGSYRDDNDFEKSIIESLKTFIGKSVIPLTMALIFYFTKDVKSGLILNIILSLIIILYVNYISFYDNTFIQLINIVFFLVIIIINYVLGNYFS
jgi:vacuolar iron transporter family protein